MVKRKPNVRKEQFDLLKDEIQYWETTIENCKDMLKHARAAKNKGIRNLLKLQKKYSEKNILQEGADINNA